jgi:hypothetical protein
MSLSATLKEKYSGILEELNGLGKETFPYFEYVSTSGMELFHHLEQCNEYGDGGKDSVPKYCFG